MTRIIPEIAGSQDRMREASGAGRADARWRRWVALGVASRAPGIAALPHAHAEHNRTHADHENHHADGRDRGDDQAGGRLKLLVVWLRFVNSRAGFGGLVLSGGE